MNKKILLLCGIPLIGLSLLAFLVSNLPKYGVVQEELLGESFPDAAWVNVGQFTGFETKADASKISTGSNPNGQNTIINDGDRVSIRDFGSEVLGTATTTKNGIKSLHTFRKRNGDNILLANWGTKLAYFQEGSDTWEYLNTTSTNDKVYGYADYNINTDLHSYIYMGNGADPAMRWNGARTTTTVALAVNDASISINDSDGFASSGSVVVCGTNLPYTSITATAITLTAPSTIACPINRGVAQSIEEFPANPRGNIYLVSSNRIFLAGVTTTPQAVYFTKYGDPTTWLTTLVADGTDDAAGIFNLGEGGGAVTGMALDEGAIYIFKKSIIYKATLTDTLYTLEALKPFDGKSQTTGAVTSQAVFTGGNGVYFITPDRQIMNLHRIDGVDYPQIVPISNRIKNTVDNLYFDNVTGITFKDHAYFAVKSAEDSANNDSVLYYNEITNSWESPIVGWTPSVFTIYDDGSGEALYFGDNAQANVYQIVDGAQDNGLGVTANWRSKRFDFGLPNTQKQITNFFVEGYIANNTSLDISLLLDEDGYTQTLKTTLVGTETDYVFDSQGYNSYGLSPFGFERFGTTDASSKRKFRVYLNKEFRPAPFYNAQVEFASDGDYQDWEIINFGFKYRESTNSESRTLYRSFK